jgi:hypothetical protein
LGRRRTLTLFFCEFTRVAVTIRANDPPKTGTSQLTDPEGKPPNPFLWRLHLQSIMHRLDQERWTGVPTTIEAPVEATLLIHGVRPTSIVIRAEVRRITQRIGLVSVVEYMDPVASQIHAELGNYELGASEIIEHCDNIAMTIDLSAIVVPENCCFETVMLDAGRIVNIRPQIIGERHALRCSIPIEIRCEFPKPCVL